MLAKIIIENGQKKLQALTADTGAGVPIGSYLYLEKKSDPAGYLYCDGSTFDETVYPALYAYLGTNVLPDWRELGAKGVGKNTTNIFDSTETDPSTGQAGTQNHDVFTQGEFKDDQLQDHDHYIARKDASNSIYLGASQMNPSGSGYTYGSWGQMNPDTATTNAITTKRNGRYGDVTRGKSRGVYIYIKATSGLTESQMDSMITILNEQRSYSTEETDTGMTYSDGKKIYKRTISEDVTTYADSGSRREFVYRLDASNIDTIVKEEGCWKWVTASSGQGRIVPINCTSIFSTLLIAYTSYSVIDNDYLSIAFASDKSNYSITKMRVEATIYHTKKSS